MKYEYELITVQFGTINQSYLEKTMNEFGAAGYRFRQMLVLEEADKDQVVPPEVCVVMEREI